MRLFVAVELAIPVLDGLVLLQEDLVEPLRLLDAEVRWAKPKSMRLDLRVIPALDPDALVRLKDLLRSFAGSLGVFELETFGTRFVPSEEVARLIAAGTRGGADAVARVRVGLESIATELVLADEEQPYVPAVRVGRLTTRGPHPRLGGVLTPYAETNFGSTRVRELTLWESEVVAGQARERIVDRFVLRDA